MFKASCVGTAFIAVSLAMPAAGAESPSYAGEAAGIAYFNVPNRDPVPIASIGPSVVASVEMTVGKESAVLVQFSSGLAVDTGEGCPCSARAMLQVDDNEPVVIKRINIGSPKVQYVDRYEHDRQQADGSYVFRVRPGTHRFKLIFQQVDGSNQLLEAYFTNMQALAFAAR